MKQLKGKARERKLAEIKAQIELLFAGAYGERWDDCEYFDMVSTLGAKGLDTFFRAVASVFDLPKVSDKSGDHRCGLAHWNMDNFETPTTAAEHILDVLEMFGTETERREKAEAQC